MYWANCLSQTPFPPGTRSHGYLNRCFYGTGPTGCSRHRCFQVQGTWLSQTPFPPGTRSPGYPRRCLLQVQGPMAIQDAVSSKYWVPCLSHTLFPENWVPCYFSRRLLHVMDPLAISDVVSSRYWLPWQS